MEVTYNIGINESYYRTLIDRYYQQRPLVFRLPIQFGILAVGSATAFGFGIVAPVVPRVVFALVIAALVFFGGIAITKWGIFQRFRYRAEFGAMASITMSETGLSASGPDIQGKWAWAAYPNAVRYADGIMLLRRGVIRWLPDSALLVGTPEDATAIARSSSSLREIY